MSEHSETVDLKLLARIYASVSAEIVELPTIRDAETDRVDNDAEAIRAEPYIWGAIDEAIAEMARDGEPLPTVEEEQLLFRRVRERLFGLSGFEQYLEDPTVENVFVIGADKMFVNRSGSPAPERIPPLVAEDSELVALVNRWSSRLGRTERRFDSSNPRLDLRLPGGYRLHAVMEVTDRPVVTIRSPMARKVTLEDMVEFNTITPEMADFLRAAAKSSLNIIVAGGTGTGKTTLLKSMLREVDPAERIITLEDTLELNLSQFPEEHPNLVEMETRDGNYEGVGEISLLELTRECLRMSPDRVVLGEVRGAEALYMLKAMGQGNDGSMCTLHAESAEGVVDRVRGYVAEGANGLSTSVIDGFFRNAVDLIIHITRDGQRRVVSTIAEVERGQYEGVRMNRLFESSDGGIGKFSTPPSMRLKQKMRARVA